MAVETDDDRSYLLADFGVTAIYMRHLIYGSEKTITGIFDNDMQEVDVGGNATFSIAVPRFLCKTSDVPVAAEDDTLTISGTKYLILSVFSDGQGMTELRLEKQ